MNANNSFPTFGAKLRLLRESQGLSLRDVARRAKMAPAFLSDIELDRRMPSDETITVIAKIVAASDPQKLWEALAWARIGKLEGQIDDIRKKVERRREELKARAAPARPAPKRRRS